MADAHAQPLVSLHGVTKSYKTRAGRLDVLKGIDLTITRGEFVAIVGPSGSGKSTLINMLTGIDRPTTGEITVAGQNLGALTENQVAQWRGRCVGVVFQFFQLLPTLTVLENVMMPLNFTGTYPRQRRARVMSLLDRINLGDVAHKYPSQLSGGQQQRAAIARALANDPELVVGDEPTGNLDAASANAVFGLFQDLVAQGTTIVFVTHDRDLAGRVPRVIEVRDGEIVAGDRVDARLVAAY